MKRGADAVVVVIGLDQSQESEGRDRGNIRLPGEQPALLNTTLAAAKTGCGRGHSGQAAAWRAGCSLAGRLQPSGQAAA